MRDLTPQEEFWQGNFGEEYIGRNKYEPEFVAHMLGVFSRIVARFNSVPSNILEFGCNIGVNLVALSYLFPNAKVCGIEINKKAADQARNILDERFKGDVQKYNILNESILDSTQTGYDFSFYKGVLMHINPDMLGMAYQKLYDSSKKYLAICDYYNPVPVEVIYRGHRDKLFKRDYAGELMDIYPDVKLIDYGFCYRRDPVFPGADMTWFLMEKK